MGTKQNDGTDPAYQALRESEELHRVTLSHISDAVFLTDEAGSLTFICPNVNVIFGYEMEEVRALGRISALLGADLFEADDLRTRGEIHNIERTIRSRSGEARQLLIHVKTVAMRNSRVLYTCRDITERSLAQEALREARLELAHAARLALAGQLTGSIAHEVAQPLTAIIANADAGLLMLKHPASDIVDELASILSDIRSEAWLATDIMRRLRSMVRKHGGSHQPLDLSELIRETVQLINSEIERRKVSMLLDLARSPPAIAGDRVRIQQLLLNLVFNAMDAMHEVDEADRQIVVRLVTGEQRIELTISDRGHGIPRDQLNAIFEPFFTTKEDGIGLGLVISRSIVEEHQGTIRAENGESGGARFHVSLPVVAPAA